MAYLIDTNVVSELRKKQRCHPAVASWQEGIEEAEVFISVISMMEIKNGIYAVGRNDPAFAKVLEDWYEGQVKRTFGGRVLSVGLAVSELCSVFLNKRTRGLADALIAATASEHGLTLATRNVNDFADTGIRLVDPWGGG